MELTQVLHVFSLKQLKSHTKIVSMTNS